MDPRQGTLLRVDQITNIVGTNRRDAAWARPCLAELSFNETGGGWRGVKPDSHANRPCGRDARDRGSEFLVHSDGCSGVDQRRKEFMKCGIGMRGFERDGGEIV